MVFSPNIFEAFIFIFNLEAVLDAALQEASTKTLLSCPFPVSVSDCEIVH